MVTMADIAERAGVALSTVSHTLSGKRPVSEETRLRVLKAIEDLDYHPNELARRLANQNTKIIGLLFPRPATVLSEMQLEFVTGAMEAANQNGYALLLWHDPIDNQELLGMTRRGLVDGLALMEIRLHDSRCVMLKEIGFPFAMMGRLVDNSGVGYVDFDLSDAVQKAVRYLYSLGHRRIALISYSPRLQNEEAGNAFYSGEGLRNITHELGIDTIIRNCEPILSCGYEVIKSLLKEFPDLSAVVVTQEIALPGMYQAAQDAGMKIPEDISFVAIASRHRAEMLYPALTSVDFPAAEMGRTVIDILVDNLANKDLSPKQTILYGNLEVRQSSGPFRQRSRGQSNDTSRTWVSAQASQ